MIRHPRNRGKGAAIRTAARGRDIRARADSGRRPRYDPADYPALLAPFERPGVTVVLRQPQLLGHSAYSFWFVMGNKLVTLWTNLLFNTYISRHGDLLQGDAA